MPAFVWCALRRFISKEMGFRGRFTFHIKTEILRKLETGNERYSTGVVANNYGGVQILGGGENSLDSSSGMNQEPVKKENLDQTAEEDDLPF